MTEKTKGQKILHFPLIKIIIGIIVVVGLYIGSQILFADILSGTPLSNTLKNLCVSGLSSVVAIFAYVYLYKFYEKRTITELSLSGIVKNLTLGILVGATLQSLTVLIIYFNGAYTVTGLNNILFVLPGLTMALSSAVFEEILLRGIIFRLTEEKLGSYIALVISALIFGALHLANPNSSILLALGLAIQAGLLLGTAYIYTRSLWFPIAIHFAWNFVQAGIFGAAVSGNTTRKSLLISKTEGESWLTGGEFGPEGSIQATLFCLAATIVLLLLCRKQGKMLKPFWSK